jgi:hypothetical protein
MNTTFAVVHGTLMPDGTLQLDEKLNLPAGRVQVMVHALAEPAPPAESLETVMARVWAGQKARGHVTRSKETIDAEINTLRDEAEEEFQAIERLQGQGRPARE